MDTVRYETMKEFPRFILVGGAGMLVNMGVTYFGVQYLGLWYLWSFCLATLIGWTVIFIGNVLFTFPGHERHSYGRKYVAFITGYFGVFWVNVAFVYLFTSILSIHYLISIVISTVITTLLTFTFSKHVVFR